MHTWKNMCNEFLYLDHNMSKKNKKKLQDLIPNKFYYVLMHKMDLTTYTNYAKIYNISVWIGSWSLYITNQHQLHHCNTIQLINVWQEIQSTIHLKHSNIHLKNKKTYHIRHLKNVVISNPYVTKLIHTQAYIKCTEFSKS